MGKNKNTKPSAFGAFMVEFISKERRSNREYPKAQWSQVAAPAWSKLSEKQKNEYKIKATVGHGMRKNRPKMTSQGIDIREIERIQEQECNAIKYMQKTIKKIVYTAHNSNTLGKTTFHFIMADYFYVTINDLFSPAELAISTFTFNEGIKRLYHTFVNPGTICSGYAFEAKERSEKFHHLPTPPAAYGEKRFEVIYDQVLDMLGIKRSDRFPLNDVNRPCVFILKEKIEMIRSILQQLSQVAQVDYNDQFDVFELELLLNEVRNVFETDDQLPISITNAQLERDQFDSVANLSCDFHENEDLTKYCALSYVRRWFFDFCDYVGDLLCIEKVPGVHAPRYELPVAPAFDAWDEPSDDVAKVEPKDEPSDDESDEDESEIGQTTAGSINNYSTLVESDSDSE